MEGAKKLKKCTVAVAFKVDVDPIVDWCNRPWTVKATPEGVFETATVKAGDNSVEIVLAFNTETFVVCDTEGNQRTITALAYQPGEEE